MFQCSVSQRVAVAICRSLSQFVPGFSCASCTHALERRTHQGVARSIHWWMLWRMRKLPRSSCKDWRNTESARCSKLKLKTVLLAERRKWVSPKAFKILNCEDFARVVHERMRLLVSNIDPGAMTLRKMYVCECPACIFVWNATNFCRNRASNCHWAAVSKQREQNHRQRTPC